MSNTQYLFNTLEINQMMIIFCTLIWMCLISLLSISSSWSFPTGVSMKKNIKWIVVTKCEINIQDSIEKDTAHYWARESPTCWVEEFIYDMNDAIRRHDVRFFWFQFIHQKCVVYLSNQVIMSMRNLMENGHYDNWTVDERHHKFTLENLLLSGRFYSLVWSLKC